MNRRDRVIQLSVEIQAERQKLTEIKERLRGLEADLDRVMASEDDDPPRRNATERAPTLGDLLVAILDGSPGTTFTAEDVVAKLAVTDVKISSVRSTLARLKEEGKLRWVGRGQYQSVTAPPPATANGAATHQEAH